MTRTFLPQVEILESIWLPAPAFELATTLSIGAPCPDGECEAFGWGGLVSADLNQDGIGDLVATNRGRGTVSIFLGKPVARGGVPSYRPRWSMDVGAAPNF